MPFHYKGQTFDGVPREKMTPGEIDWVERSTGLTYKKIQFLAKRCVCEHDDNTHLHFTKATAKKPAELLLDDLSCTAADCGCDRFEADMPSRCGFAFLAIAAKRHDPSLSWDDVMQTPQDEWTYESDVAEESPDPTEQPPAEG